MEKELSRVLQGVKEKTGILVQAISENGEYFASTMAEYIADLPSAFTSGASVIQLEGKTYFKFNFGGNLFYAVIGGDGESERRFANLIAGYIELSESKPKQLSFDEQLGFILTGNSTKGKALQFMNDYSLPKNPLYVMTIKTDRDISDISEFLSSYFGGEGAVVSLTNDTCAYIRYVEQSDAADLLTPVRQAEILKRSVFEELGVVVNVYVGSIVKSFLDVSKSYFQALSTEKASRERGLNGGVYAYKDYLLDKIAEELPPEKLEEYLSALTFSASEILGDEELLTTGDCFLRNNLNVSETAREMYIHRNTLIYRLEKIEKLTGLDIKKFSDALNFKLLYIISKMDGYEK
ncbi:MAG: helix-turn-helix domain-containing protein [Clostridia bacterium]|nr:helix-turn-helix domain-containing protein [Clostridia bacterium]